ncbi:glyoxalase/bleomycin resistance protein/dioxygenase [Trichoderma reesei RUT C-30]|uniref:Bleomycin resistance protein n=1 Tax=Hypocrea jecorina (strain ATCC 56765 / BCRC 32924 / NRRL 11460 / Rut C-30) TaxID=1344414 RepID=A0A024RV55_HYPJR|nr:glyoxalase/bleomycin resistance protein/dioxygenase [Trichoderma reesei RUT C-30]
MEQTFQSVVPVLRIFDARKAEEFYLDFLGFTVDWDHRFDDNAPLYRQISKGNLILHLSEHHGDGSPGVRIRVLMGQGITGHHEELIAKNYRYMRPGLEKGYGGPDAQELTVIDPFGNKITFCQVDKDAQAARML